MQGNRLNPSEAVIDLNSRGRPVLPIWPRHLGESCPFSLFRSLFKALAKSQGLKANGQSSIPVAFQRLAKGQWLMAKNRLTRPQSAWHHIGE